MKFCGKFLKTRSKYSDPDLHKCFLREGHQGPCEEEPFLKGLGVSAPRVKAKIHRDATMTTGASWKSEDAGPNRIRRWVMLKSDTELLGLGIDMAKLKPQVVAKLREKAADYDACMAVAQKLTYLAYCMTNAPAPPQADKDYLEELFGPIVQGTTVCQVCREPLDFGLFEAAKRGKAEIETSHSDPRLHAPGNVGFAHRACNIAQGNKTIGDFYNWIEGIVNRVKKS